MEPKMTQEHYDQIVEQHDNGAILRLHLIDTDISTYCKPDDDIEEFITKCKLTDRMDISFSVSSGALVDDDEENQKNDTSDKPEKDLNEILGLLKVLSEITKDEENEDEDEAENENDTENPATKTLNLISDSLKNNNRIHTNILDKILSMNETIINYHKLTPTIRVCVITIPTGHEVIGVSQIFNAKNDIETISNKIAYNNAKEKLWEIIGNIAKTVTVVS